VRFFCWNITILEFDNRTATKERRNEIATASKRRRWYYYTIPRSLRWHNIIIQVLYNMHIITRLGNERRPLSHESEPSRSVLNYHHRCASRLDLCHIMHNITMRSNNIIVVSYNSRQNNMSSAVWWIDKQLTGSPGNITIIYAFLL